MCNLKVILIFDVLVLDLLQLQVSVLEGNNDLTLGEEILVSVLQHLQRRK